jgi:hypothetical protein
MQKVKTWFVRPLGDSNARIAEFLPPDAVMEDTNTSQGRFGLYRCKEFQIIQLLARRQLDPCMRFNEFACFEAGEAWLSNPRAIRQVTASLYIQID